MAVSRIADHANEAAIAYEAEAARLEAFYIDTAKTMIDLLAETMSKARRVKNRRARMARKKKRGWA